MRTSKRKKREGAKEVLVFLGRDPIMGKVTTSAKAVHDSCQEGETSSTTSRPGAAAVRPMESGATLRQLFDLWLEECERLDHPPTTR